MFYVIYIWTLYVHFAYPYIGLWYINYYFIFVFIIKLRLVFIIKVILSGCGSLFLNISITSSRINFVLTSFHHTTCESTCDTLASSAANQGDNTVMLSPWLAADEARVSHVLSHVVWWKIYIYRCNMYCSLYFKHFRILSQVSKSILWIVGCLTLIYKASRI